MTEYDLHIMNITQGITWVRIQSIHIPVNLKIYFNTEHNDVEKTTVSQEFSKSSPITTQGPCVIAQGPCVVIEDDYL